MKNSIGTGKGFDGYWLRTGWLVCEAISNNFKEEINQRQLDAMAEYLARVLDAVYKMGIGLGELSAKVKDEETT